MRDNSLQGAFGSSMATGGGSACSRWVVSVQEQNGGIETVQGCFETNVS